MEVETGAGEGAEQDIRLDAGRAAASVEPRGLMTRALTLLFAVAGGVAVGNLYLAQPLLDLIARDLGASTASAGWLVTATQLGYAAGILLIVPLGDVRNRRHLIPAMMLCAAAALTVCAVAPSMGVLLIAISMVGVTTVAGQILAPLAGDLADVASRGRVVGIVVSGILTGILVSRTLSGLIADAAGWRVVFATAAVAGVVLAVLVYHAIPPLAPKTRMKYPALLASVGAVVRRERALRWTMVLGATTFATFTMFWTTLTFLLSAPPFSYNVSVIGLFGLFGLVGVIAAQRAGRLHDRGVVAPGNGGGVVAGSFRVRCRDLRGALGRRPHRRDRPRGYRGSGTQHSQPDASLRYLPGGPQPDQHRVRDKQLHRRRNRLGSRDHPLVDPRLDGCGYRGDRALPLRARGLGRRTPQRPDRRNANERREATLMSARLDARIGRRPLA